MLVYKINLKIYPLIDKLLKLEPPLSQQEDYVFHVRLKIAMFVLV